jgi:putative effector of murein hydrolase LrgA (UPF0299 family)
MFLPFIPIESVRQKFDLLLSHIFVCFLPVLTIVKSYSSMLKYFFSKSWYDS